MYVWQNRNLGIVQFEGQSSRSDQVDSFRFIFDKDSVICSFVLDLFDIPDLIAERKTLLHVEIGFLRRVFGSTELQELSGLVAMEETLELGFCGVEISSGSHAGKISWGKIAPRSGHHLNLGSHDSYFCMAVAISLVETNPYRLEYIFCRFQPSSGHGNDFFMKSLVSNMFSFSRKIRLEVFKQIPGGSQT